MNKHCTFKTYNCNRIAGLEINCGSFKALFLCVYMPCDSSDNDDDFMFYLSKLLQIADEFPSPHIFICGDSNANIHQPSRFGKELIDVCNANSLCFSDKMLLPNDTYTFMHSLESGKSAGLDGLNGECLKYADVILSVLLSFCFTCMFKHSYLPSAMLDSVIIPLVKNKCGDLSDISNYRPIAVSCIVSKIFENVILLRIEEYLWTTDNQFGFKAHHSTDLCVYALTEFIEHFKNRSTSVYVAFLDAIKAFDKINHWLLFKKLIERQMPLYLVTILCYWYRHQVMFVRWGSSLSTGFRVTNGVRQGGILSPLLFNVYINDLSIRLSETGIGGSIGGKFVNHMIYADDLCVISLSSSGLQSLLNICTEYCQLHDLTFNAKKSVCMFFRSSVNKQCGLSDIFISGSICEFSNEVKYLGVMINSSFKTTNDVQRQTRNFYARANLLIRNFRYCTDNVKCYLFQSYCTNMYCCQLWFNSTKGSLKKLKTSYNSALRRFLMISKPYSASQMFVSRGILSFDELLRKSIYRFVERIENSTNSIIHACLSSSVFLYSFVFFYPFDFYILILHIAFYLCVASAFSFFLLCIIYIYYFFLHVYGHLSAINYLLLYYYYIYTARRVQIWDIRGAIDTLGDYIYFFL